MTRNAVCLVFFTFLTAGCGNRPDPLQLLSEGTAKLPYREMLDKGGLLLTIEPIPNRGDAVKVVAAADNGDGSRNSKEVVLGAPGTVKVSSRGGDTYAVSIRQMHSQKKDEVSEVEWEVRVKYNFGAHN